MHVRNDQERRVLQRERVLPQLVERGVEVRVLPLVLPGEAVTLPHVRPAPSTGVLERAALEAVVVALGVGLRRGRLAEQPAQVDEVLLRRGALLQLRSMPLRNELVRGHRSPRAERLFTDHPLNFTAQAGVCPMLVVNADAQVLRDEILGGRGPSLTAQFL